MQGELALRKLESCTRLRTHPNKTQVLAPSRAALAEFQQAGVEAHTSAEHDLAKEPGARQRIPGRVGMLIEFREGVAVQCSPKGFGPPQPKGLGQVQKVEAQDSVVLYCKVVHDFASLETWKSFCATLKVAIAKCSTVPPGTCNLEVGGGDAPQCSPKILQLRMFQISNRKGCPPEIFSENQVHKSQIARGVPLRLFRESNPQISNRKGCLSEIFQRVKSQSLNRKRWPRKIFQRVISLVFVSSSCSSLFWRATAS